MLTQNEIEYFKTHQDEITQELLDALRTTKKGKRQALEILDTPQNEKRYYLDVYNQPISFDGNKGLKKPGTLMPLFPIHQQEIERCTEDFVYFRENYIQIKTPKGVDFPDMRDYQNRLIDAILDDQNEEVVGLIGRQCIDGDTILELEDQNIKIKDLFDNPSNHRTLEFV